ncbi:hypothetical protein LTR56_000075 [Elasticomyces elasticus]|nr:hypothetical protein LTR56_000075 [Elasticomyces elasticus]KAK3667063.1 hypothetical protein LTR22_001927 [Elasticomyces elasticus]KAK4932838.1 hypothetical protein LTR49_000794 [Elasticomyces elasticus]KAK5768758.1 hypothetical protein LTS12_001184 [Elasticomyces elasticus]
MVETNPKTALIVVDLYNDFLHPDGKATSAMAPSQKKYGTIEHIRQAMDAARAQHIPIFYSFHQQYFEGKYEGFQRWNAMLDGTKASKLFEVGSWGAKTYEGFEPKEGDTVIAKHWNQSSFANTDLDWLLKQQNITHVVFAGLLANSCLEASGRYASELGFNVTMLKDATAGWTIEEMDAATTYGWTAFAHKILSTEDWVKSVGA